MPSPTRRMPFPTVLRAYPNSIDTVTEYDAVDYCPKRKHDVVIANPPFGRVRDGQGQPRRFDIPGNRRGTSQIDQAIALWALAAMKDNGRAVLILGGKLGDDEATRSERYNSLESRGFFKVLYDRYHITQHLSIWGCLYRKQGAGWPIDLIVIEGRGQARLPLPAAKVPPLYKSFAELKDLLPNEPLHTRTADLPGLQQLSLGLETAGNRRSGAVPGESPPPSQTDELADLPPSDDAADSMDDSNRPGTNEATSDRDAKPFGAGAVYPQRNSGTPESLRDQHQSRARADFPLGQGVGGSPNRPQRDLEDQIPKRELAGGVSLSRDTPQRSSGAAAMAGRSRRNHPGQLARGSDLRHELAADHSQLERSPPMNTPEQSLHVSYVPRSQGHSPDTLIPTNMAAAAQKALDRLEKRRGDLDEFVFQRLGYDSKAKLWDVLYAEQIDALALAFDQRDNGKIFLNGDQTGNGKGRFGAATIIDAQRQGYIPVFVTQKPNLYNSMLNDLADIGRPGFTPFVTNNTLTLKLDNGGKLKTFSALDQEAEMLRIMQQGLGGYDAVFTTYNQLQTVNSKEPFRRQFLKAIAPKAVFIFDESHEAGGSTGESAWKRVDAAPDRAEFVRSLVDKAAGAVFMSATATKDPAVMDLYARRTDARHAISMNGLKRILKTGGIPLQQMMATKFVASGQLLRRERSFENISFDAKVVPVNRQVADGISAIMRGISAFDQAKEESVVELSKALKREAKNFRQDNSIGQTGVKSTNFTSLMHNAIDQGLLAQKAEAAVQAAISSLQSGEKPLIAVASTMDVFIGWYTQENGIEPGESLSITFGDVLERYLERSRDVLESDYEGQVRRWRLTDEELGAAGVEAYEAVKDLIAGIDLSAIPLSSIDYIKWRLRQEGYSVDEITGRQNIVEYSAGGERSYGRRSSRETNPQSKVNLVNRFNSGQLDVLILNRSGATGINLHASEQFSDQRPRHMIVAQAERDINQVMQMLGRVNRFGQVVEPRFTLLMSDLPAEKRLGALLSKKMASLNANTTAARDSDLSVSNVVDFMNSGGEEIVTELLEADPELEARLAFPSRNLQGSSEIELVSRVTGRIPLLSIDEQEDLYDLIESETQALIAQRETLGESLLKAQQLDLDARTLARMQVIADDSDIQSEFTGPVYLEVVDAKVPLKPPTQLQVINTVRTSLGLTRVRQVAEHDFEAAAETARRQAVQMTDDLTNNTEVYRQRVLRQKGNEPARIRFNDRIDAQLAHVSMTLRHYLVGVSVQVIAPEGGIAYGVVSQVGQKGQKGSPAAPTNWRIHIVTDQAQQLQTPLSRFNTGKESSLSVRLESNTWQGDRIYDSFDLKQAEQRTTRQLFTGNILKAYEKYPKGKFINYTDYRGNVRQGLIMPASFDIQEELRKEPVAFHQPHQVQAFLTEVTKNQGVVKDLDQILTIKTQTAARLGQGKAAGFLMQTPKATQVGGRYFLDPDILAAVGSDFYSVGDRMEAIIPADRIEQVLTVIMRDKGFTLATFDFKEHARSYLGESLPELEQISEPEESVATLESAPNQPQVSPALPEASDASPIPESLSLRIAPAKLQTGGAEKNTARFLEKAGLTEAVMQGEDFHLRIENEPFIPLVVERHDDLLYLTHYLTANGDTFIDTEMVFSISGQGGLSLQETAVNSIGGEYRGGDRGFAQLFSRNILKQGFAEAALQQQAVQISEPETAGEHKISQEQGCSEGIARETPASESEQVIAPTLFDVERFLGSRTEQAIDSQGYDPSWNIATSSEQDTDLDGATDDGECPIGAIADQADTDRERLSDGEEVRSDLDPLHTDTDREETVIKPGIQSKPVQKKIYPSQPSLKELADQVRDTNLEAVAVALGFEQDRYDKHKWKDDGHAHIISINGPLFMDWIADYGSAGAINLVMHVRGVDFKESVQWLSGRSLTPLTAYPRERRSIDDHDNDHRALEIPSPDERRWQAVRQYLAETRGLPINLVEHLHAKGLLYADTYQNAVFLRHAPDPDHPWKRLEANGAVLRGTWGEHNSFHKLAPGSSRSDGWFWVGIGRGVVKRVFLTEAPIDTLSLAVLDRRRQQSNQATIFLSTDGSGGVPTEELQKVLNRGGQVIVAFDADMAGEMAAWRVAEQLPGVRRVTPAVGKDWNERLLAEGEAARQAPQDDLDKQTLKSLWRWYQAAHYIGKSPQYLARITEVARDFVKGEPLSDRAKAAMQHDFQKFQGRGKGQSQVNLKRAGSTGVKRKLTSSIELGG
ncbi:MAG: strawberry notch C-terminal domain-containing protein [Pseudanabaenales cyanobacterium]|nr:strawberry notch C-terminal domain-containing protein [Pseudanabaenales cyanobacterium]